MQLLEVSAEAGPACWGRREATAAVGCAAGARHPSPVTRAGHTSTSSGHTHSLCRAPRLPVSQGGAEAGEGERPSLPTLRPQGWVQRGPLASAGSFGWKAGGRPCAGASWVPGGPWLSGRAPHGGKTAAAVSDSRPARLTSSGKGPVSWRGWGCATPEGVLPSSELRRVKFEGTERTLRGHWPLMPGEAFAGSEGWPRNQQ